jgi:hypothetical protein
MIVERYQPILTSIWQDEKFSNFDDDTKLLWFYFLTCPQSNILGLFFLPKGYVITDLNWDLKRFAKPFGILLQEQLIEYDDDTKVIFIKNQMKHRSIENENQAKAAIKVFNELPETVLFQGFSESLKQYGKPFTKQLQERLQERLPKPVAVAVSRKPLAEAEIKSNTLSGANFAPDPVCIAIFEKLTSKVKAYRPNHKIADINQARKPIETMLRLDKRDPNRVLELLEWYPIGQQYMPEIFSANSLREKFDKLENAFLKQKQPGGTTHASALDRIPEM